MPPSVNQTASNSQSALFKTNWIFNCNLKSPLFCKKNTPWLNHRYLLCNFSLLVTQPNSIKSEFKARQRTAPRYALLIHFLLLLLFQRITINSSASTLALPELRVVNCTGKDESRLTLREMSVVLSTILQQYRTIRLNNHCSVSNMWCGLWWVLWGFFTMTSLALKKFRDRSVSFTSRRQRSSSLDCVLNVPTRARRSSCFVHGQAQVGKMFSKDSTRYEFLVLKRRRVVKMSARYWLWWRN